MIHERTRTFKKVSMAAGALLVSGLLAPATWAQEGRQSERMQSERNQAKSQQQTQGEQPQRSRADRIEFVDQMIEAMLATKLAARPGFGNVEVEVNDGLARLSGSVESETKQQRAVGIARSTIGVDSVRNQLKVDKALTNAGSAEVNEDQLTQKVAEQIAANIEGAKAGEDWWFDGWRVEGPLNRWNFTVEADGRHVILEGDVPRAEIITKAVQAASKVSGVRTVDSDLEVEGFYGYYDSDPYLYGHGPYYGRAYRYNPNVLPPHARARGAGGEPMARQESAEAKQQPRQ